MGTQQRRHPLPGVFSAVLVVQMGFRFTECRDSVQYFLDPGRCEIGIGVGIGLGEDGKLSR